MVVPYRLTSPENICTQITRMDPQFVFVHVHAYISMYMYMYLTKITNEEEAINLRVGAWKELKGGIGGVGRNEGWREEEKSDVISL